MPDVHAALYDATTGQITATAFADPGALAAAGDWVELPPETELGDLRAWMVDLETLALVAVPVPPSDAEITAERDRRINAGFTFMGHRFDCDPAAKQNISGAASLALGAIVQGAVAGDLAWTGTGRDFAWLSYDNTPVAMDAQTVFAFGAVAAEHVSLHIFAARALKDAATPVLDYAADHHWPAVAL